MNRKDAEALIKREWPQRADELVKLLRPEARLVPKLTADGKIAVGQSKFGGSPDVPQGFAWPRWNDKPISFLVQLDTDEVLKAAPSLPLPKGGLISVFYANEEQPWGLYPTDRGGIQTYFWPKGTALQRMQSPKDLDKNWLLNAAQIQVSEGVDLPDPSDETPLRPFKLKKGDDDRLEALRAIMSEPGEGSPLHRLFGYPNIIQNSMEDECETTCGDISANSREEWDAKMQSRVGDWLMWLQFDSDDSLHCMWGDAGRLYFWIRKQDLAPARFDRGWMCLQCY
ncbi:MAG: DUF1963 domain-containing protein [Planctomycetes bacterium]|nr:DUF1963 domain-containing protein [Planctomycetota bacterium]